MADHENNAVRIANREIAHVIRPIRRFGNHLGPSLDDFSMVSIDIPNPLEKVNAGRAAVTLHEMDRRVVAPYHRIVVFAEVPVETQLISIKSRRRFHV